MSGGLSVLRLALLLPFLLFSLGACSLNFRSASSVSPLNVRWYGLTLDTPLALWFGMERNGAC